MKKSILNLGAQELTKNEQKNVKGGGLEGSYCNTAKDCNKPPFKLQREDQCSLGCVNSICTLVCP